MTVIHNSKTRHPKSHWKLKTFRQWQSPRWPGFNTKSFALSPAFPRPFIGKNQKWVPNDPSYGPRPNAAGRSPAIIPEAAPNNPSQRGAEKPPESVRWGRDDHDPAAVLSGEGNSPKEWKKTINGDRGDPRSEGVTSPRALGGWSFWGGLFSGHRSPYPPSSPSLASRLLQRCIC